jgi:CRP/FNR family transcriptional regulator, anaerobic regulatory protein
MIDKLLKVISKTITPTQQDIDLCTNYFEMITVPKNTIIEEQYMVPNYLYFIINGYMRLFYCDTNGDEQTTYICFENDFITSFLSFIHQKKANENVECVTECTLLRITPINLRKIIDESNSFKTFSLVIFEQAIAANANRANSLATLNAEQRYKKLIENETHILQNLPIQYIASYLGMKPESLSRIRKQIIS